MIYKLKFEELDPMVLINSSTCTHYLRLTRNLDLRMYFPIESNGRSEAYRSRSAPLIY